jgi:O-antigen/teichoic acid export membrane protein
LKKALLSTSLVRVLLIGFSMGQGILVARCLLDEGKGVISLYVAALNLTLALGDMGGKQAYAFFMAKRGMSMQTARSNMQWSLMLAVAFEFVFLSGVLYFQGLGDRMEISLLLLGVMVFKLYNSYSIAFALADRNFWIINGNSLLTSIVSFLGVALFVGFLGRGETYFFVAMLMGVASSSILLTVYRHRLFGNFQLPTLAKFDLKELRAITSKGLTYAVSLFIMGLNYRLDLFLLDYFKTKSEVGIYSQGASLAQMLWLLPEVVALVIFSYSLNATKEKKFAEGLLKYVWKMMGAMGALLIPIGIAAFYLIPVIYGASFADSSWVFVVILPGVYVMIMFKMLNGDLAARGYPLMAAYVFAPAVVLNVVLNILLIPEYSGLGAAVASSISYTSAALVYLFIYRRMTTKLAD